MKSAGKERAGRRVRREESPLGRRKPLAASFLRAFVRACGSCADFFRRLPLSDYRRGLRAEFKGSHGEAEEFYARDGSVAALHRMAALALSGKGGNPNRTRAFELWRLAAERGDVAALYNLGVCYAEGCGVRQNVFQAVRCFQRGARKNDAECAARLARMHQDGLGIPINPQAAEFFWRIAAERGDVVAQRKLGELLLSRPNREKEAFHWLHAAARKRDLPAQDNLARCFFLGKGVEKSLKRAFRWWRRAADAGYAKAQFSLAVCWHYGIGVRCDESKCELYLKRACEQGDADALAWKERKTE